jgi:hypothetical protein
MIANKLIGSLTYRTREVLRNNQAFLTSLERYRCVSTCFANDNKFSLWHYPGTHGEISAAFLNIDDGRLKFPSILNFNPIKEVVSAQNVTYTFNLAFVAPTFSEWCTEEREAQVFELLLTPVYKEFLRQVVLSRYFVTNYGDVPHTRYKVFTTGKASDGIIEHYGDYIDALEVHGLTLKGKTCYTPGEIARMRDENDKVFDF